MPYMKNDTISQSPIEGGIEISGAQYQSLLAAKLEGKTAGKLQSQRLTLNQSRK